MSIIKQISRVIFWGKGNGGVEVAKTAEKSLSSYQRKTEKVGLEQLC